MLLIPVSRLIADWHQFARDFGRCFVARQGDQWLVYLPTAGQTRLVNDMDEAREVVSQAGCTGIVL